MTVAVEMLIQDLNRRGVRLTRNADRLHVEAPRGIVTEELKETLAANKPALLAALSGYALRARLADLADSETISRAVADAVPDNELTDLGSLSDDTLRAYLRALRDADLRARGQCPPDESARAMCAKCGPVWVHPCVAAVAPMVDNWARVLGCPWCHLKNRRSIPRPSVACGTCQQFKRDPMNSPGGLGSCSVRRTQQPSEPLPYPFAPRTCAEWCPLSQEKNPC
jgi:hypothetical protein